MNAVVNLGLSPDQVFVHALRLCQKNRVWTLSLRPVAGYSQNNVEILKFDGHRKKSVLFNIKELCQMNNIPLPETCS